MVGVGRQDIGSRSVSIEGEHSEKESALQKTVLINREAHPSYVSLARDQALPEASRLFSYVS